MPLAYSSRQTAAGSRRRPPQIRMLSQQSSTSPTWTHFSYVDGATAIEAKDTIESNFNDLRQGPTQSIAVFKKEFDTQVRALEIAGGLPIEPEQLALKFPKKLDQVRHGAILVQLLNGRSAGGAFLTSANDAYVVAKDWRSA